MANLISGDGKELQKLDYACKEWGFFQIATNEIYKSIEHRAVVNSEQERLSIATFHNPNMDGFLSPAPSLITPETPALFNEIRVVDFYKRFFGNKLHGKSNLDYQRIQKEKHGESRQLLDAKYN